MKKSLFIAFIVALIGISGCEGPGSAGDERMNLYITDIPTKYDGCMMDVTILDDEDAVLAYCGGNAENGTLTTVYATDSNDTYWIGNASDTYRIKLDFLYDDDPDTLGFLYVDATLANTITGGPGTISVSAIGTTFSEHQPGD